MSQNIMILSPWGAGYMDAVAERVVAPHLHPRTDLVCTNLGERASPMPWPVAESSDLAIERAIRAQAEGIDAIVVGCCADPFISEMRRAVRIPVVGITESVCATARSRGKITLVARRLVDGYRALIPLQRGDWKAGWTEHATRHGLGAHDISFRQAYVPGHPDPETLTALTATDTDRLRDLTLAGMKAGLHAEGLDQARAAVREDGAKAVYFACAFWSEAIAHMEASAFPFDVQIINPLVCAVSYAEHLLLSSAGRLN